MYHYSIDVRDLNSKLYTDNENNKLVNSPFFKFEDNQQGDDFVERVCRHWYRTYKAICKDGTKLDIAVRWYSHFTDTYMLIYSLSEVGGEVKFIKH